MDRLTRKERSKNMSNIKSKDTSLETRIRRELFRRGFRYRIHYSIKGRPDVAFPVQKIAIFIHGCFWHLHGCSMSGIPKTNTGFWKEKLEVNKKRDLEVNKKLRLDGWNVITLWECKLEKNFTGEVDKLLKKITSG